MSTPAQERVYGLLHQIPTDGLDAVKRLFWVELNYDRVNSPLSTREWPETTAQALDGLPVLLAQCATQSGDFDVIYTRLSDTQTGHRSPLSLTAERLVIKQLSADHPYALYLFSDPEERHWHLVNAKVERVRDEQKPVSRAVQQVLRRIAVGPHERLRTAAERIAMLDVAGIESDLFGRSVLMIQQRHDDAFNVEAVTGEFFAVYCRVFSDLEEALHRQTQDRPWAHDYALQFLNRLMFLYYVQRKRWLGDDPEFLASFWTAYRGTPHDLDTFVSDWLSVLFFEAFNKRFQAGRPDRQYLPQELRDALATAPYLNGGLFTENALDRRYKQVCIDDRQFERIFSFLERYNFTISEDTPLDQEVAVDPEMIGKVYESLVNVSENVDERGAAGIFYTPRVEIDLMCRLSLVNWFSNHLGEAHRNLLYEVVFAFDPEEKEQADQALTDQNLWPRLHALISDITVLDPACGSGSFLVGMLYVLDDLLARANRHLGFEQTPYERKRGIIGQSLYGVDVMDWAVHVAELRLWLQLVIDTVLEPAELQFRPLLPNLSFRLRQGDSLVQEVGGIDLALRTGNGALSPAIKGRITQLKGEKLKFYHNEPQRRYRTDQQLRLEELRLFRDLLAARIQASDTRRAELEQALAPQVNLFGEVQTKQLGLDRPQLEAEVEALKGERERLIAARDALRTVQDVPFVWDIAFVEVFSGERPGFDLVIGNPPYVRQEMIRDPQMDPEAVTAADKRAYKDKLARAIYSAWPQTFGYDWSKGRPRWKLDAKSDLYIYFYFYGLSLLNDRGVLCFITSNAWLDVGYGRDLQRFLISHGDLRLVLDNQARRSFASADVNTVIVLLGTPQDQDKVWMHGSEHKALFVMLGVTFEHTLASAVWQEIERVNARFSGSEYSVLPLSRRELWDSGMDQTTQEFAGDKWGAKYLRAPDIYWVIQRKGAGKLVELADVAQVRFGLKTGANEFFHLDETKVAEWAVEAEFLRPFLFSLKEIRNYEVNPDALQRMVFVCHASKAELHGNAKTGALRYIEWGEQNGFHRRPSVKGRRWWYALPDQEPVHFVSNRFLGERFAFPWIQDILVGDVFFTGRFPDQNGLLGTALLNSTISFLSAEVLARKTYGIGVAYLYGPEISAVPILSPQLLDNDARQQLVNAFGEMRRREILRISDEVSQPDRRLLDDTISDMLGLTNGEKEAVREALVTLVDGRLRKAQSLEAPKVRS